MFNIVNFLAIDTMQIVIWVIIALLVVVMFVLPMFTGRKRQKEVNDMYDSIQIGDEIMTIGGVMGKVISLSTHESGEKLMVIETGDKEKTTMTFTVQALRLNFTKTKQRQEQLAKARAEKEKKDAIALAPDNTEPKDVVESDEKVEVEENVETPAQEAQNDETDK